MQTLLRRSRLLVALLAASVAPAVVAAPPALEARLDAIFEENITSRTPGCALGLRQGDFELQRAWGQADLERDVALTVDNVFDIGSVAKQVTAMAVLLLARDGKLELDDDIRRFLPELPTREEPITIDDLIHHTSGLRDFRATGWLLGRDVLATTNADVLAYAARQHDLNHAPGESYLYSNTGYVLLALIVERASGRSFSEFTRDRLFAPVGMAHTRWEEDDPELFVPSREVVPSRALGYTLAEPPTDGASLRFVQYPTSRRNTGNGGLLSTVGDMMRWNDALRRDAFGTGMTARLEQPGRLRNGIELNYARGLIVGDYRGLREVQHGGYTGTFASWVGRYPEIDLSLVLLCNSDFDGVNPHDIADLLIAEGRQSAAAAQGSKHMRTVDLSVHDGMYRNAQTGDLKLMRFPAEARLDGGRYDRYVRGPLQYAFNASEPGRIVQHYYGNEAIWKRLPAAETPALDAYVGRYHSDELLGGYQVRLDGEQLTMSVHGVSSISTALKPVAGDVFLATEIEMPVEFQRDGHGNVVNLRLSPSMMRGLDFERVE